MSMTTSVLAQQHWGTCCIDVFFSLVRCALFIEYLLHTGAQGKGMQDDSKTSNGVRSGDVGGEESA